MYKTTPCESCDAIEPCGFEVKGANYFAPFSTSICCLRATASLPSKALYSGTAGTYDTDSTVRTIYAKEWSNGVEARS
jgi:hypothetical protein